MKKIFTLVVLLGAVAMVGCCGNNTKKAAAAEAVATETVEAAPAAECCGKCEGEQQCTEGECADCEKKCTEDKQCAECTKEQKAECCQK